MSDYQQLNEVAVDRREETVVTQQPGYAATEQVTRDVAVERRLIMFQITRILYGLLVLLEVVLAIRVFLRLIAANAASGFATLIYAVTWLFVMPFNGLVGSPTAGGSVFEATTLIAMAVYALVVWGIASAMPIMLDRPTARTTSRSTVEQTAGGPGNERTTRTTIR